MLQEYMANTHAATHSSYTLELVEVFKIEREGEPQRFKPFKKLHNHKLLWHGSRTTNYAGIISQGLRIAPPEAPVVSTFLCCDTRDAAIRCELMLSPCRQGTCLGREYTLQIWFPRWVVKLQYVCSFSVLRTSL